MSKGTMDDAVKSLEILHALAKAIVDYKREDHDDECGDCCDGCCDCCDEFATTKIDAIHDACVLYCDDHECDTCKVNKMIDEHFDDCCLVCEIANSIQPIESILSEVMRYVKEEKEHPQTYAENFFQRRPDAVKLAIEKNGMRMPHVCRANFYEGLDTCPGGKTCWECWNEPMKL